MEAFRQQGIIAGEDLQTWEERKAALNSATGESTNTFSKTVTTTEILHGMRAPSRSSISLAYLGPGQLSPEMCIQFTETEL